MKREFATHLRTRPARSLPADRDGGRGGDHATAGSGASRAGALRRARAKVRAVAAAVILLTVVLLGLAASCHRETKAAGTRFPMLLIGVDGMEWTVMRPLLDQGKLPVIKGLMDRGVYGSLSTMNPTYSPVIWTTIATGKGPDKHGIDDFVYVDEADKAANRASSPAPKVHVYTSGHRRTKAFWNILGDYALTVDCVGWWITWPAESINGVMVSQTNTGFMAPGDTKAMWKGGILKGVEKQVTPASRQGEVMATLAAVDTTLPSITREIFGDFPHPLDPIGKLLWDETQWSFRADSTYVRVGKSLLAKGEPPDLFAIYFGGPDVVSHRFWRYAHPEQFAHPPAKDQIEDLGGIIDDEYMYVDRMIGELLATQPPDVTVMIVSDHGFHAVNQEHEVVLDDPPLLRNSGGHTGAPPTVFIAAGRFIDRAARISPETCSVLDLAPTVLALKGIPIGRDMDGKPILSLISKERLAEAPIRTVETHDSQEWLAHRSSKSESAGDDAERLEQLRSLGYNVSGNPTGDGTSKDPAPDRSPRTR